MIHNSKIYYIEVMMAAGIILSQLITISLLLEIQKEYRAHQMIFLLFGNLPQAAI